MNKESKQTGICIATKEQLHLQVLSCRPWCEVERIQSSSQSSGVVGGALGHGSHGDGECWGEDWGQYEAVRVLGQAHSHGCAEQVLAAAM